MPLITTAVTFKLLLPDGAPAQGVKLTASLSSIQTDGGIVVRARRDGITNASGIVVLDLWPNTRGDGASHYVIRHSGLATEGLRADEFRIAVGETGTANADDLLVDVSPGGSVVAPSPSAMLSHMRSQLGHLSGAQVTAGAVGHVAANDTGVLLLPDGTPAEGGGGLVFTQPNSIFVSDGEGAAVELQAENVGDVLTVVAGGGLAFAPQAVPEFSLSDSREYTAPQVENASSLGADLADAVSVNCAARSVFHGAIADGATVVFNCDNMLNGQTVVLVLSRNPAATPSYVYVNKVAGGGDTLYSGDNEIASGVAGVILRVTRRGLNLTRFVEVIHLVPVETPVPPDYTSALSRLPFDGTIEDVSGATSPYSPLGPATFSSSEKVFGSASLHVTAGRSVRFADSSVFNRQTGDFAYQVWAKRDAANSSLSDRMFLFGSGSATGDGTEVAISVAKLTSGVLSAGFGFTDGSVVNLTGPVCPSGFFHCYVARKADKVIFAVDGVVVTATVPVDKQLKPIGNDAFMAVGCLGGRPGPHLGEYGMSWDGWIDHFVYTDFAQWDTSFTPPNNPV